MSSGSSQRFFAIAIERVKGRPLPTILLTLAGLAYDVAIRLDHRSTPLCADGTIVLVPTNSLALASTTAGIAAESASKKRLPPDRADGAVGPRTQRWPRSDTDSSMIRASGWKAVATVVTARPVPGAALLGLDAVGADGRPGPGAAPRLRLHLGESPVLGK
ncbi:hypothetical protein ACGFZQ_09935 [Streptomyces sp. NPDC048254]|uniref:hypothetical protein n=1 Tax=Streptomyces sp. NPDC048254 TaxID=3365525 RepID=UPI00371B7A8B